MSPQAAGRARRSTKQQPHPAAIAMPPWRQKLIEQRAAASAVASSLLNESAMRERQAREKLARLKAKAQRELTRAASVAAVEDQRERKKAAVAEMRAENDRLIGRDMNALIANVPMPSEEEILTLSRQLNDQLKNIAPDAPNFFALFKFMDIDGSRRISFEELEIMCRRVLKLNEKKLSLEKLHGLWKALDANFSGFIDAGELSRFLRLGQSKALTPAQLARKKMLEDKAREKMLVRAESNRRLAKDVAKQAMAVERATAEEVQEFGAYFAKANRGGLITNYYTLFKTMDADASGRVSFQEVRHFALTCAYATLLSADIVGDSCSRVAVRIHGSHRVGLQREQDEHEAVVVSVAGDR